MRHLRTIVTTSDSASTGDTTNAVGVVLELLVALLAVLGTGDVRIAHRDLGDLASAWFPDAGVVELNPAATLERQAAGLVHGLRAIAAHHGHASLPANPDAAGVDVGVVRDLLAAASAGGASPSGRPVLRLVPGGAR